MDQETNSSAMTITEALAEVKLIDKKIAKKKEFIVSYLFRGAMVRDPLDKDGGSAANVLREMQAITDLEERKVSIRSGVARANASTPLEINGRTRTVADWLVWRRDVSPLERGLLQDMVNRVNQARAQAQRGNGQLVPGGGTSDNGADIIVNINEIDLQRRIENLEEVVGRLDGLLSLHNARTTITI